SISIEKYIKIEFAEPLTRSDFLKYSCPLTLDLNTANKYLRLTEENRRVTRSKVVQSYPDHPHRFDVFYQVLCREGVSGRCYWEVEWSGRVHVSVSYKGVSRKGAGENCGFGRNDQSWSLVCSTSGFSFWHNNKQTELTPVTSRIGVYVNHRAGTLSFYSVSHTMTLLYRTTFTQPLYPGFWVGSGSVKLL
uniref:B30.2/SPRY domain-containing protein n=1 Tax=Denticeps clupeoides TaxID=299321 RepID=A0AAY4DXU9_9TELE